MRRRTFLGYGSTIAGVVGLAGCLGQSGDESEGGETSATGSTPTSSSVNASGGVSTAESASTSATADGYPPSGTDTATERAVDTDSFDTVERNGVAVPLAPVDVTRYWHQRREARFADARGEGQYERARVLGAVLSPANGGAGDDPVTEWPKDDRIVCYCGCPHHLSSIRAADLLSDGYENVYVIDEGVHEWQDRGYPMAGSDTGSQPDVRVIRGRVASEFAGESAWARHGPTEQHEATGIGADGSYELELKFADITADSPIRVRTPGYTLERPLGDLTDGVVTG